MGIAVLAVPGTAPLVRRNWGTLFQCFSFSKREQWKLALVLDCRALGVPVG